MLVDGVDDDRDPLCDFMLSLAWAADRAGYSPDEANDIAGSS